MAEYSGVDVGLATTVGHLDSGGDFTDTNSPSLKPVFTSAIIETELVESLFFVVDFLLLMFVKISYLVPFFLPRC